MPDYRALVDRVTSLDPRIDIRILADVSGCPVYLATINPTIDQPRFWINAGTHGDEPAGVEAALLFLETWYDTHHISAQLLVTPCLNVNGYLHNRRENAEGVDANWAFERDDVPEVRIVKQLIKGSRFDAVVDLHEDWESPGYYLYEQYRNRASLGHAITSRVARFCPVNKDGQIEGEIADRGVIYPDLSVPKRKSGEGLPVEVFKQVTDHQITSESPSERPMAERVRAHLTAIDVFLEAYA